MEVRGEIILIDKKKYVIDVRRENDEIITLKLAPDTLIRKRLNYLELYDLIIAEVKNNFIKRSSIIIPSTEENVKKIFLKCIKSKRITKKRGEILEKMYNNIDEFYDEQIKLPYKNIREKIKNIDRYVHNFLLNNIAEENEYKKKFVRSFIINWRSYRLIRQGKLFDLNMNELKEIIKNGCPTLEEFYNFIGSIKLYKIISITIEKCDLILYNRFIQIINEESKNMRDSGIIAREFYKVTKNLVSSGIQLTNELLNSLPNDLGKNFSDIYWDILRDEYNFVVYDYDSKQYIINPEIGASESYLSRRLLYYSNYKQKNIEWNKNDVKRDLGIEHYKIFRQIMKENIAILSGPAGSGKTTLLSYITKVILENEKSIALLSYTGKAVMRIKETIKQKDIDINDLIISTIHRFIGILPQISKNIDVLIIDECSMVDTILLNNLLRTMTNYNIKPFLILFVGDFNQLPPVNGYCFFHQFMTSSIIPKYELKTVMRTKNENSKIITNLSSLILDDKLSKNNIEDIFNNDNLVLNQECYDYSDIIEIYFQEYENDIKIITPKNDDINMINRLIQDKFIQDEKREYVVEYKGKISVNKWAIGDIVMYTNNDYILNIMNGQEGIIIKVDEEKLYIKFENNHIVELSYTNNKKILNSDDELKLLESGQDIDLNDFFMRDTDNLKLSYCISVHKSQGSEWNKIIFYIPTSSSSFFVNKELIYTGITRAKNKLILCTTENKLLQLVRKNRKIELYLLNTRMMDEINWEKMSRKYIKEILKNETEDSIINLHNDLFQILENRLIINKKYNIHIKRDDKLYSILCSYEKDRNIEETLIKIKSL